MQRFFFFGCSNAISRPWTFWHSVGSLPYFPGRASPVAASMKVKLVLPAALRIGLVYGWLISPLMKRAPALEGSGGGARCFSHPPPIETPLLPVSTPRSRDTVKRVSCVTNADTHHFTLQSVPSASEACGLLSFSAL